MIRGFQQDASWSRVRWLAEIRLGLFGRKQPARRAASEIALRRRLQRAKREGDLPKNADPAELARYVMTVLQGMAVQGADGASRDQLRRVAQMALRAWPKR